ncbi:MAG: hypothetical protein QOH84_2018 [Kribbellaceae bacterium]|nr:hypothetical protein [Kribbellaceae bacterium]
MATSHMSEVLGVRLDDGRKVVIKSRQDPTGRAATCVAVQRHASDAGFPCARPLSDVTSVDDLAVHAEEWRPGGEMIRGDSTAIAERSAKLYAQLGAIIEALPLPPPLPNPEWVNWAHTGPGRWPPNDLHDTRPLANQLPPELVQIATRTHARLTAPTDLPRVLNHADWESQNLRWTADSPHAVHDWDSIAWLPEAALVGAASGAFASTETPTLPPIQSSEAFITAYQTARGRPFTPGETHLAWAASLWTALHNARAEHLWNTPPVALTAVLTQAEDRLQRAGA